MNAKTFVIALPLIAAATVFATRLPALRPRYKSWRGVWDEFRNWGAGSQIH
jgi:hypothetical protein